MAIASIEQASVRYLVDDVDRAVDSADRIHLIELFQPARR